MKWEEKHDNQLLWTGDAEDWIKAEAMGNKKKR